MSGFVPISEYFLDDPLEFELGLGQSYDDFTLPFGATVTKTQTAKARVQKTLTAAQTAKARIQAADTATQAATARITNTAATKTQTAKSRIQITGTKTQTAKARIQIVGALAGFDPISEDFLGNPLEFELGLGQSYDDFTLPDLSVVPPGTKTQTAKARIQNNAVTKAQTARVRVQRTLTKTQTSVARVQKTLTKTQTSVARIQNNAVTKTQTSTARIVSSTVDLNLPYIPANTHVWDLFSEFDPDQTFTGPGSGGGGTGSGAETFLVRLNLNGVTTTATLATAVGLSGTPSVTLTGDSGMPTDQAFVITVDSEQILLMPQGGSGYLIRQRAMGNTTLATHSPGATVSWGDSYDMTVVSGVNLHESFTASVDGSPSHTYPGWLMCFDSTQAYFADGTRVPFHVTEVMGVFDAGAGVSGSNRCDAAQPNAVSAPVAASDHCGVALSNPSRIQTDIVPGDVAVCRYTNPLSQVLDLGPRSGALQSWYGMMRVDASNVDVTFTNPNGFVIDTVSGSGPGNYTSAVQHEYDEPIPLATGIAPAASDAASSPIPTPTPVPWMTTTLPASDRHFTRTAVGRTGWPIGVVAVRQGNRRVPFWQSWDWHNYSYVYSGFGTDDSFAQIIINRNGIVFGSVPSVELPNDSDIDGPDVVWDDDTYYYSFCWYIALYNGPYLVQGETIGGTTIGPGSGSTGTGGYTPGVTFPPGGPPIITVPPVEGGSGGDITPSSTGLHGWSIF